MRAPRARAARGVRPADAVDAAGDGRRRVRRCSGRTPHLGYFAREGRRDHEAAAVALERLDLAALAAPAARHAQRRRAAARRARARARARGAGAAPRRADGGARHRPQPGRARAGRRAAPRGRADRGRDDARADARGPVRRPAAAASTSGRVVAAGAPREVLTEELVATPLRRERPHRRRRRGRARRRARASRERPDVPARRRAERQVGAGRVAGGAAGRSRSSRPATAGDDEMAERIERHRAERPAALGHGRGAGRAARGDRARPRGRSWSTASRCGSRTSSRRAGPTRRWRRRPARPRAWPPRRRTIAVSNEVGLGVVPATPLGRRYRDVLGRVNASWAEAAEDAYLVVAGRALRLERLDG